MGRPSGYGMLASELWDAASIFSFTKRYNLRKSALFNHISEENVAYLKKYLYLCSEIQKMH